MRPARSVQWDDTILLPMPLPLIAVYCVQLELNAINWEEDQSRIVNNALLGHMHPLQVHPVARCAQRVAGLIFKAVLVYCSVKRVEKGSGQVKKGWHPMTANYVQQELGVTLQACKQPVNVVIALQVDTMTSKEWLLLSTALLVLLGKCQ